METQASIEKLGHEQDVQYASSSTGEISHPQKNTWEYWKHYFTSREGWIGDYVWCQVLLLSTRTDDRSRTTCIWLLPIFGPWIVDTRTMKHHFMASTTKFPFFWLCSWDCSMRSRWSDQSSRLLWPLREVLFTSTRKLRSISFPQHSLPLESRRRCRWRESISRKHPFSLGQDFSLLLDRPSIYCQSRSTIPACDTRMGLVPPQPMAYSFLVQTPGEQFLERCSVPYGFRWPCPWYHQRSWTSSFLRLWLEVCCFLLVYIWSATVCRIGPGRATVMEARATMPCARILVHQNHCHGMFRPSLRIIIC